MEPPPNSGFLNLCDSGTSAAKPNELSILISKPFSKSMGSATPMFRLFSTLRQLFGLENVNRLIELLYFGKTSKISENFLTEILQTAIAAFFDLILPIIFSFTEIFAIFACWHYFHHFLGAPDLLDM